jgi:hypothetical protein
MTTLGERLRIALDLWETGVILRREALRREYPDLSDEQIESLVNQWLATRPGAEKGDGPQQ